MAPESMSRLADCRPAPSTVSGAQPTRTPAASRRREQARGPPATSSVSGFSLHTCLPAAIAAPVTSACATGMVRFTISWTSGWPSASAGLPQAGTP